LEYVEVEADAVAIVKAAERRSVWIVVCAALLSCCEIMEFGDDEASNAMDEGDEDVMLQ